MLILLTIFTFILISILMVVLRVLRPKLSIQGFLVVIALLVGMVMVSVAKIEIPTSIALLRWSPEVLFPVSPLMLIDQTSWLLVLAIVSLAVTIVLNSIARLGWSLKKEPPAGQNESQNQSMEAIASELGSQSNDPELSMPNWMFWVSVLVFTSTGILAVTAGNLLTLLLTWTALDLMEAAILIGYSIKSDNRERAAIIFSAKVGSTVMLMIATLVLWSKGGGLNYSAITSSTSILFIFPAAIRLGVLPPMIPYSHRITIRQDLITLLYLVPAAAAYILLVRVASAGATGTIIPFLIGLVAIIGLVTAIQWLTSSTELGVKRFWMVTCASLAVISAILNQPLACLAWSIAGLLSGGLIFSLSIRYRNLIPIIGLGIFNLSMLPFSPTWQAGSIYHVDQSITSNRLVDIGIYISLLIIQAILLAGFIRHTLRGLSASIAGEFGQIERWVWVVFPIGLIIVTITHLVIGWFLLPDLGNIPITAWITGPITILFSGLILYASSRYGEQFNIINQLEKRTSNNRLLTNDWLYDAIWQFYRSLAKLSALISTILEGEGGIIWALVLFGLIFIFLQR